MPGLSKPTAFTGCQDADFLVADLNARQVSLLPYTPVPLRIRGPVPRL